MNHFVNHKFILPYSFGGMVHETYTDEIRNKIRIHNKEYSWRSTSIRKVTSNPLEGVQFIAKSKRSQRDFIGNSSVPRGIVVSKRCLEFLVGFNLPSYQIFNIDCQDGEGNQLEYFLLTFNAAPFCDLNFQKCEIFLVERNGFKIDFETNWHIPTILKRDFKFNNWKEYFAEIDRLEGANETLFVNKYVFDVGKTPCYDLFLMGGEDQNWYISEKLMKDIKRCKYRGIDSSKLLLSIEWA